MKLGEKIKLLRTEKELTQPELADKAGIEQSYLSKLENDKGSPSFDIINRIAMSLETTGMDLINSLSQSYVEDYLSHIPEVAAEYASIMHQREISMKKRFITAACAVVFGIGIFLIGSQSLIFPDVAYHYRSDGVIKAGEILMQFNENTLDEINETHEEASQRLRNNKTRFDRVFLRSLEDKGERFVAEVDGGRRYYQLDSIRDIKTMKNDLIMIFGMMLIVAGFFAFLFIYRFKPS